MGPMRLMRPMRVATTVLAFAIVGCAATKPADPGPTTAPVATAPAARPGVALGAPEGAWEGKDPNGQRLLRRYGDGKIVLWSQGRVGVVKIVDCGPTSFTVKAQGRKFNVKYEIHGDQLTVTQDTPQGPVTMTAHRLASVPEELLLRPLKLGAAGAVDATRLKQIQDELAVRLDKDQAVRKKLMGAGPANPPTQADYAEMMKTDIDNTAYVKKLVTELGWIDAGRFGFITSNAAFLIIQHSGDLPLMLAALPEIEKDVKTNKGLGQAYALLYDRTQLMLGKPQRYGSQVGQVDGKMAVLPLEDRKKVDEYRKSMGMEPLADYLSHFGASMKDVVFLEDDSRCAESCAFR